MMPRYDNTPWSLLISEAKPPKAENKMPKHYIINKHVTVLIWEDGSKTIIRKCKEDKFDKRIAFLTAYFQKHCGLSKRKANEFLANLKEEETNE